jgi:hypothetical protein
MLDKYLEIDFSRYIYWHIVISNQMFELLHIKVPKKYFISRMNN